MRFRTVLLIVVAILVAAFLFINWRVFAAPANISFLVGSVQMPLGVVMVGLLVLVVLAVAVYVGIWQGTLLMDLRRQSKELQAQRNLADDAEASRFTELGNLLRAEMAKLDQRMEAALEALRGEVRDAERSVAATLGEMDDRLQREHPRGMD